MPTVALQPSGNQASRKHYVDTIERPVSQDVLAEFLPPSTMARIKEIYGNSPVPTWGVTPGQKDTNVKKWERLRVGAVTLFSADKNVFASGVVTLKFHNEGLAERLWGRHENGQTWEYMYLLDEIYRHKIPYEEVNRAAGYKPNFVFQGFNVLEEEKSARILDLFELNSVVHLPPDADDAADMAQLDREARATVRVEQPKLRKLLFSSRRTAACILCQREIPVQFLVVAHIKKRASCSDDEKRDLRNIAAPMCRFGCDELYERGYVGLDDGAIVVSPAVPRNKAVADYVANLAGKKVATFGKNNQAYFRWHLDNVFKA